MKRAAVVIALEAVFRRSRDLESGESGDRRSSQENRSDIKDDMISPSSLLAWFRSPSASSVTTTGACEKVD
jgi:hypothetical protein